MRVIKGLPVCCFTCLCFTVITLLWMAVLCTAIQTSVHKRTGRRTVLFTNRSPPHRKCSAITGWDPVIG
ncbi:unnamed protein product, partial [Staurois parvus]